MPRCLLTSFLAALALSAPSVLECEGMCSCGWQRDPRKALDGAVAVLAGVALDSLTLTPRSDVPPSGGAFEIFNARVLIDSVWKGEVPDTLKVYTSEWGSGCGFRLELNHRYLLFLYRTSSGRLFATMCSLSQGTDNPHAAWVMQHLGPVIRRRAA
jgi:hypothetical protein